MKLWNTREESQQWLRDELQREATLLDEGFDLLDRCISIFDDLGRKGGEHISGRFARVCGLTLVKARNLALGCYSLSLDALAQEGGALLRPLIETYELLVYFREKHERVDEAIDGKLPSAGQIAQAIGGQYHSLRKYLNDNASHFGFKHDSVRHLVDNQTWKLKQGQTHSKGVFQRNIALLSAFLSAVIMEGITCLFVLGIDANDFADTAEAWRDECKVVFHAGLELGPERDV